MHKISRSLTCGENECRMQAMVEEGMRMDAYMNELSKERGWEAVDGEMGEEGGRAMDPNIMDMGRYELPGAVDPTDPESWTSAVDNANAQLEHQQNRVLNLQLLLKHGPNVWRAQNEQLNSLLTRMQERLDEVKGDVGYINRERKLEQESVGQELGQMKDTYMALVEKNARLTAAIDDAESRR